MNSQKYKKEIYPEDFNEDDKLEFDILLEQSKMLFPNLSNEEWLIKTGVISFIRKKKNGDNEPLNKDEIAKIKNDYLDKTSIYYYEEPILKPEEQVEIEA